VLQILDDQTVGVAQSGARTDRRLPSFLDDLGAGGDLPRDRLVQIGVEDRDGGLRGESVLFGVKFEDEKRPDGDDMQTSLRDVHVHIQPLPGELFVEADGPDQVARLAEHSGENSRSEEVGEVGMLPVDASNAKGATPTMILLTGNTRGTLEIDDPRMLRGSNDGPSAAVS
jgi:hypothetical protein